MSSSRDSRRENRDLIRNLADKDGQVQALQERILEMEEEIAIKDVTTTNLRFGVELLLKKQFNSKSQICGSDVFYRYFFLHFENSLL